MNVPAAGDPPPPGPGPARRPWLLIVASLMLAALSAVLWVKWEQSRHESRRLHEELRAVYAEAEALRTQANQAQQRMAALEAQLRRLRQERDEAIERARASSPKPPAARSRRR